MNKINKFFLTILIVVFSFSGILYAYTAKNSLKDVFKEGDVIGKGWYNAVNKLIGDGSVSDGGICSYNNGTISCIDHPSSQIIMSGVGCGACPNGATKFRRYRSHNTSAKKCKNLINGGSSVKGYESTPVCYVRGDHRDNKKLNPGMLPKNVGYDEGINTYWYAHD